MNKKLVNAVIMMIAVVGIVSIKAILDDEDTELHYKEKTEKKD